MVFSAIIRSETSGLTDDPANVVLAVRRGQTQGTGAVFLNCDVDVLTKRRQYLTKASSPAKGEYNNPE